MPNGHGLSPEILSSTDAPAPEGGDDCIKLMSKLGSLGKPLAQVKVNCLELVEVESC
jgi:hypothetical protein